MKFRNAIIFLLISLLGCELESQNSIINIPIDSGVSYVDFYFYESIIYYSALSNNGWYIGREDTNSYFINNENIYIENISPIGSNILVSFCTKYNKPNRNSSLLIIDSKGEIQYEDEKPLGDLGRISTCFSESTDTLYTWKSREEDQFLYKRNMVDQKNSEINPILNLKSDFSVDNIYMSSRSNTVTACENDIVNKKALFKNVSIEEQNSIVWEREISYSDSFVILNNCNIENEELLILIDNSYYSYNLELNTIIKKYDFEQFPDAVGIIETENEILILELKNESFSNYKIVISKYNIQNFEIDIIYELTQENCIIIPYPKFEIIDDKLDLIFFVFGNNEKNGLYKIEDISVFE